MCANGSRAFDDGGLSPEIAASVYDRIGRFQDTQTPFERPALDRLIALARFDTATSVFGLGCGVSSRMVKQAAASPPSPIGRGSSTPTVCRCRPG